VWYAAYLVAVVGDELQQAEAVVGGVHFEVLLPRQLRFLVHDVAPAEPREVAVVLVVLLVHHQQERLLRLLVVPNRRLRDAVVPVEVVVIVHVRLAAKPSTRGGV